MTARPLSIPAPLADRFSARRADGHLRLSFGEAQVEAEDVFRSAVTLTEPNALALRDMLNQLFPQVIVVEESEAKIVN